MFKSLLVTQLRGLLASMFTRMQANKSAGTGKKILIGLLAVYVVGMMLFSFGGSLFGVALVVAGTPQAYLIPLFGGGMAILLSVIGSVFAAEHQIFRAKDNELLLSMPIPPRMILLSRLAVLWILCTVFSLLLTIPLLVVWCITCPVTPAAILALVLGMLLLPVFALAVICLLAWFSAWLSERVRVKNLGAYVVLGLGLAAYLWVLSKAGNISEALLSQLEALQMPARRWLPPAYWFSRAVASPEPLAFAAFTLWCVVPMAAVAWLLSANLVRLITARRTGKKAVYREKAARVRSPFRALVGRELRRLFTTPAYLLNSCFGIVVELILAGFLLIRGAAVLQSALLPDSLAAYLPAAILTAMCFRAAMTLTTAVSVSLEGKTFPLLRSLPVTAADVLRSKLAVNLLFGMPPLLLLSAAAAYTLKPGGIMTLALFLLPQLVQVFAAVFGLFSNLKLPNFTWVNETALVKQSGSVMLGVLGALGLTLLIGAAVFGLAQALGLAGAVSLACVGVILIDAGLTAWLFSAGLRRYESL